MRYLSALLIAAVIAGQTPATASSQAETPPDKGVIEKLTGAKAKLFEKEGIVKVQVPRLDLRVKVAGTKLVPPMGTTSWAAFKKAGEGTMVMGDLVLQEDQVSPVMDTALANGLEVTGLHNHFLWDSPRVMFMHVAGIGNEQDMASAMGKVFAKIKETAGGKGSTPGIAVDPASSTFDPAQIEKLVGIKGEMKDGAYRIAAGRTTKMRGHESGKEMGVASWAAFAGSNAGGVVDGDFVVLERELQGVLKELRKNGMDVVAIHNHMTFEEPRMIFLHFWGTGNIADLAKGVRDVLAKTATHEKQ